MTASPGAAPDTTRRTVATVNDYAAAERIVDFLSDEGFAVERVAIVGTGLRYVEQVAGRVTTGSAATTGMAQGAMLGLFWGLLFSLFFDGSSFFGVLLYSIIVGTLFGAIVGAASHYALKGRRDFTSARQTLADRYEIQVDDAVAAEAEQLVARMPAR